MDRAVDAGKCCCCLYCGMPDGFEQQCESHDKFRVHFFKMLFRQAANLPKDLTLPSVNLIGACMIALNKAVRMKYAIIELDNVYAYNMSMTRFLVYPAQGSITGAKTAETASATVSGYTNVASTVATTVASTAAAAKPTPKPVADFKALSSLAEDFFKEKEELRRLMEEKEEEETREAGVSSGSGSSVPAVVVPINDADYVGVSDDLFDGL